MPSTRRRSTTPLHKNRKDSCSPSSFIPLRRNSRFQSLRDRAAARLRQLLRANPALPERLTFIRPTIPQPELEIILVATPMTPTLASAYPVRQNQPVTPLPLNRITDLRLAI